MNQASAQAFLVRPWWCWCPGSGNGLWSFSSLYVSLDDDWFAGYSSDPYARPFTDEYCPVAQLDLGDAVSNERRMRTRR